MRKWWIVLGLLALAFNTAFAEETPMNNVDDIRNLKKQLWTELRESECRDPQRVREIEEKSMDFGDKTMRYTMSVIGEADETGYPVYICLHGGGETDPAFNDSQWSDMGRYYLKSVEKGIYIAPRGVTDTWDLHFVEESYPLYERLIENLTLFYPVDTNRVYLLGYSAGGDGVYQVSARLADRFGAVNMSAGHPNGVCLENLYNLPIQLQVGEKDTAYDRNRETARYNAYLNGLAEQFGGGYIHNCFIHAGMPHNFYDYNPKGALFKVISDPDEWLESGKSGIEKEDTNAVHFVSRYSRNPIPEKIVWNLSTRARLDRTDTFYWLGADPEVTDGRIVASFDREKNTIFIEEMPDAAFTVYLNEDMADLFQPVTVKIGEREFSVSLNPSEAVMTATLRKRWDPEMIFCAAISIDPEHVSAAEEEPIRR